MLRWLTAAIAAMLLTGCGADDEPGDRTTGDASPTATQTAPAPGTTQTSTTSGRTSPGAREPARGDRPEQRAVEAVRRCLAQHGYRATGGVRRPGTPNAPSYEILVAGPRGSAFIAFYDSVARAKRYAGRLRRNARRFKGASVERQGTITTVWVKLTDTTARARIRDCVRQET